MSSDPTPAVASSDVEVTPGPRGSLLPITLSVAGVVLLLDQLTKWLAVTYLEGQPSVEVIGPLVKFTFVRNPGAAFSLGGTARSLGSKAWAIALGGLLGGALGNLLDRIFREPGFMRDHVVDFIQLPHWPVFNVADMAVVGAAILMVLLALRGIELDGRRV